jgi:ketosteroid isomerase-like protein
MSTTDTSRRVIESFYEAVAAGDMDAVIAAFADDVVVEVMGSSPISGRHVGREAFLADAMGPIMAVLDPETVQLATTWEIFAAEGDRVAARMTGTAASLSGKRYDNSYCQLFRIRDGQIAEMYEYLDTALLEDAIFDRR